MKKINFKIYYEINNTVINLIIKKIKFPYSEVSINVYYPFYDKISFNNAIDELIVGGEELMLKFLKDEIVKVNRKTNNQNIEDIKIKQLLNLNTIVEIDRQTWMKLKKR